MKKEKLDPNKAMSQMMHDAFFEDIPESRIIRGEPRYEYEKFAKKEKSKPLFENGFFVFFICVVIVTITVLALS